MFTDGIENSSKNWKGEESRERTKSLVAQAREAGIEIAVTGFVTDDEATKLQALADELKLDKDYVDLHVFERGDIASMEAATLCSEQKPRHVFQRL